MFNWVGFKQKTLDYERKSRKKGESKFKLMDILTFKTTNPWKEVVRGITSFSLVPLYLPLIAGFIMSIISFLLIIYFFMQKIFMDEVTSGWTSLFLAILLIGGLILIILGTIGIYIGKMFEILRGRPKYIIKDTINLKKKMTNVKNFFKKRNYYILVKIKIFILAFINNKITIRKIYNLIISNFLFLIKSNKSGKAPIVISVDLWNECNENCVFCRDASGNIYDLNPNSKNYIPKLKLDLIHYKNVVDAFLQRYLNDDPICQW